MSRMDSYTVAYSVIWNTSESLTGILLTLKEQLKIENFR